MGGMNFDAALNCGYFFLKNGFLTEARVIFNRLQMEGKLNPLQKKRLKSVRALVVWKDGQLDDAVEMLEELMEDGYKTSAVYETIGLFYIIGKDAEKALKLCTEAYEYDSDDDVLLDNLAEAYALCGEKTKAKELYEKLLERSPRFPEPYFNYGVMLMEEGRHSEGVEYIGKALEQNFSFLSVLSRERVEDIYFAHRRIENE